MNPTLSPTELPRHFTIFQYLYDFQKNRSVPAHRRKEGRRTHSCPPEAARPAIQELPNIRYFKINIKHIRKLFTWKATSFFEAPQFRLIFSACQCKAAP